MSLLIMFYACYVGMRVGCFPIADVNQGAKLRKNIDKGKFEHFWRILDNELGDEFRGVFNVKAVIHREMYHRCMETEISISCDRYGKWCLR